MREQFGEISPHPIAIGPPRLNIGVAGWLRRNLFNTWYNSLLTLGALLLIYQVVTGMISWALLDAAFGTTRASCKESEGACWSFVIDNWYLFSVGTYPYGEKIRPFLAYGMIALLGLFSISGKFRSNIYVKGVWLISPVLVLIVVIGGESLRPIGSLLIFCGMFLATLNPALRPRLWFKRLWIAAVVTAFFLVWGSGWPTVIFALVVFAALSGIISRGKIREPGWLQGVWLAAAFSLGFSLAIQLAVLGGLAPDTFSMTPESLLGLKPVDTTLLGGFMLTLILSVFGIIASFPIGILLALGRRSEKMPIVKALCVVYIEVIRGVPLITVLFMSSVVLPLFFPEGWEMDKVLRAQIGIILFSAAYLAEVVRGGLQAIPRGQEEAAAAVGLNYGQMMGLIVLPQALRIMIPALVSGAIGLFKDTSLVTIIGLIDFLSIASLATANPEWVGKIIEAYVFIAAVYWVFCFSMSRYSLNLENKLKAGQH